MPHSRYKMYSFVCDYLEGCLPQILEALRESNLEQTPGYGNDSYCSEARDIIRKECGLPDAEVFFLVGGTQTNSTVISHILRPHQGVLCASTGHINVHETGAIEHGGHKVIQMPSKDGRICAEQLEAELQAHFSDPDRYHSVQPGMVYISLPTELGTLYSKAELSSISDVCGKWRIPLFIDGARLGYGLSSPACDLSLKDVASLADIFYIGGTKQGALFGEAVVFRSGEGPARDFKYFVKQNGALLAKGRLLGIQFKTLFADGLYLRAASAAVEKALRIKKAFSDRGTGFLVDSYTNQQFPILSKRETSLLKERFDFEFWKKIDEQHDAVRFCTSWATTDDAVESLIRAINDIERS